MKIKDFFEKTLFLLGAPRCVACRERLSLHERALCENCMPDYEFAKTRLCSACFKPLCSCACSNDYLERRFVHKLIKLFRYGKVGEEGEILPANELIYNIKRDKRTDILSFLSGELAESIRPYIKRGDYVFTSVPRQRARVIKYGFDHSRAIAEATAKLLRIEYMPLLRSKSKKAQKKTHGEERIKNAVFAPLKDIDLRGKRVIIFDDVVTTGASMGASAMQIKALGAKEIIGVCIAIAFRDKHVYFENDAWWEKR